MAPSVEHLLAAEDFWDEGNGHIPMCKVSNSYLCTRALILFIQTLALYKSYTYLLTYLLTEI